MKLYGIWISGSGGDVVLRYFISRALTPLCSVDRNHLCNLVKDIMSNNPVKLF